ncbi:hypothetical protein LTR78_008787 [Recurvomyces mirabilis]|uniref:Uncharacterized protein n=1 Tax=Recurvomyces mirabilis TaxID=574656 RepID=A0AAE0TPY0_9PEZI|nr:hypothetical protein LTR78_008787 [Recurvomyces mirabilis]
MPFREKAKAIFKRKTSDSLSKASSNNSSREQWPSNVYKPGEVMPRPKYRKPPTKEHKEHLESFSFADAWRRRSFQSVHSPMGTRAPSRKNSSRGPSRRGSLCSRKSYTKTASRAGSVSSAGEPEKGGPKGQHRERERFAAAVPTSLSTEEEADGDDDVHNVGLSRVQSYDQKPVMSRPLTAENTRTNVGYFPAVTAHDHLPFSENELALALQRSHLAVPAN